MPFKMLFKNFWSSLWKNQENTLETVGLLAFFVPSIMDPIIFTFAAAQDKTLSDSKRATMVRQNWTHHMFNLIMEVLSLVVAKPLVGILFKGNQNVEFYKKISGFIGLMLTKSLIRPFVMLKYSHHESKNTQNGQWVSLPPSQDTISVFASHKTPQEALSPGAVNLAQNRPQYSYNNTFSTSNTIQAPYYPMVQPSQWAYGAANYPRLSY